MDCFLQILRKDDYCHIFGAFFLLLAGSGTTALAGELYFETGFGLGQIGSASSLYTGIPNSPSFGLAGNLTFAKNISSNSAFIQIHLGLKTRYVSSSDDSYSYSLIGAYPLLRIEVSRFYFGGGISPFVLQNNPGEGSSSFIRSPSAVAYMAEAGLVWRVVPFFYLALEVGGQFVKNAAGTLGPKPSLEGTFQMRFLTTPSGSAGSGSRKFDGWRYPFGIEIF